MKTKDQQAIPVAYLSLPESEQEVISRAYEAGQHLYFILAPELNLVKIGITHDPYRRLKGMQVSSPTPLELVWVMPFGGRSLERRLHNQFQGSRKNGEWFDYNELIKGFILMAKKEAEDVGLVWDIETKRLQHV